MGNKSSSKKFDTSNTPANEKKRSKNQTQTQTKPVVSTKAVPFDPAKDAKKSAAPQPPVVTPVAPPVVPVVEKKPEEEKVAEVKTVEVKTEEIAASKTEETPVKSEETPKPEEAAVKSEPVAPEEPAPVETTQTSTDSSHATVASKKTIDFYYMPPSPPCRSVMMLAKAIGVDLNLKFCNVMEGEHLKEEFLKINPQHCIPTMDDDGFILWESRAIMGYLVNQYAKDDSLYPQSPEVRALVDQRLYFDQGTLYQKMVEHYYAPMFGGALDPEKLKPLEEAMGFFNAFLEGNKFAAGENLTIADFALVATISTIEIFGMDFNAYPNVMSWYAWSKEAMAPYGYQEINQAGVDMFAKFVKEKMG